MAPSLHRKPAKAGSRTVAERTAARGGLIARLSDEALLEQRFCDLPELKVKVAETPLRQLVELLYAELAGAGLKRLRPRVYLGDEWFSPEGLPLIAMPFFLAHPRLRRLERKMMASVEGGTRHSCMELLRHEAGHCFDHAYGVAKTRAWRQVFGVATLNKAGVKALPYRPEIYAPNSQSRDFVRHLPGHYAQAHPDEDFAETFAVVVTPGSAWRERYRNWPKALEKCAFVAGLLREFGDVPAQNSDGPECYKVERMRLTLGSYYARRLAERRSCAAKSAIIAAQALGHRRLPSSTLSN